MKMINQKKSGGKVSADRAPATDWLLLSQKQIHFAYFRLCIAYQMLHKKITSILYILNYKFDIAYCKQIIVHIKKKI